MKRQPTAIAAAVAGALAFACGGASATDGYFSHGYGMTAKGMGGAATAMSKDTFGGANNPASMVWVGDRIDAGLDVFSPHREASRTGSTPGSINVDGAATSDSNTFFIPEFGYNAMVRPDMSVGVSVYGNGGMNTDYPGGQIPAASLCAGFNPGGPGAAPFNLLCGNGRLGVDLSQLIIAPTWAMKINDQQSVGVSPLFGYQRFKADGLQGFIGFTPNPMTGGDHLTNQGYASSFGFGLRLGWQGRVSDAVTLGAAYSTKVKMGKFDKYKDLFAGQGGFDMPANFDLGIAFKATPAVTLAVDYQRIDYAGVPSVANASTYNSAFPGSASPPAPPGTVGSLGCDACRGFGWQNVNVYKLGLEYALDPAWTLRAGYNHSDNPIQARDVTFNILAPGVVQNHLTLGFTYAASKANEITMAYMHASKNSVSGKSLFNNYTGPLSAGTETISMYENSLGVGWARHF